MKLFSALCAGLLLLSCYCSGQDIYSHLTVSSGLPTNKLNSIIQDKEGYIWIASRAGATRYNGQTFKTYDVNNHLKTNDVFDINIGLDGRIYLMDYRDGLDYIRNDSVYTVRIPTNRFVFLSVFGGKEYLWSFQHNYMITGDTVQQVNTDELLRSAGFAAGQNAAFTIYRRPYLILVHSSDVYCINLQTGQKAIHKIPSFPLPEFGETNGFIVINYHRNGIALYSPANDKLKYIRHKDTTDISYNTKQIIATSENIQLTTDNGLLVFNRNLDCIDSFAIDTRLNSIVSVFRDRTANIWMLSADKGLKFVNNYYRCAQHWPGISGYYAAYAHGKCYLSDVNGNIIITDTLMHRLGQIIIPQVTRSSKNVRNTPLLPTDKGVYVPGNKNLALINDRQLLHTVLQSDTTEEISTLKKACYVHGTLYELLYNGVYYWDEQKGVIHKLWSGLFSDMTADSHGDFWLVTDNKKQCRLHRNNAGSYELKYMQDTHPALAYMPEPTAMASDTSGHVLLAYDHMLVIYDPVHNTAVYHPYKNTINGCCMSGGKLFVYTGGYIDMYTARGTAYTISNRYYNFDHALYEDIISLAASENMLYISAGNGITGMPLSNRLKPDSSFLLQTHISFITHNNIISRAPVLPAEYIYSPGRTEFNIASVSFSHGRGTAYRYYLEGVDKTWQQSTAATISYASLPPGNYQLHIITTAPEYDLSSNEFIYNFDITPLWWQRKTVQLLAAIAVLVVLLLLSIRTILVRKNKQLRMVLLEKKAAEVQLGTLQSQMNPHFVFNALTSVQSFLKRNKNEEAGGYLLEFTRLIRLYLEFSRKRYVTLGEELEALRIYTDIEARRFNNRFVTHFRENFSSEKASGIYIPPMIIQPFVENAINHGLYHKTDVQGILLLMFDLKKDELTVTIDDNGIGRERSSEINGTYRKAPSRGNEIVNERIQILAEQHIMNITIRTTDRKTHEGASAGTVVTITFKLNNTISL